MKPKGSFVTTAFLLSLAFLGTWLSLTNGHKMLNMMAKPNQKDLVFMGELLEKGKVAPIIDRCYPLNEVPEALRYLGQRHAKGKVVITMANGSSRK